MSERDEFIERSLADLDREHEAGDLSDADHAELRARYERRRAPTPQPARRRPGLMVASMVFVVGFAIVAGVLVARVAGRRDADDALTGAIATVPTTPTTEPRLTGGVEECIEAEQAADASLALDCYLDLTEARPDDAAGYAYFGWWLTRQSFQQDDPELVRAAEASLDRAVELDPALPDTHVFLAVLYERAGRLDEARAALATFDALDPPPELEALVVDLRERLAA